MKLFALSLTALALVFAAPAFAADESYSATTKIEKNADGDMTKKVSEESKDAAGTAEKTTSKEKVDVQSDGDVKTSAETKTSTDPEGMMNKSTTEDSRTEKMDSDGDYSGKATSESKDADGATNKETVKATVDTDGKGHKTKKVKHKKVHDPKGLMNKTTETTTDTTKQMDNGEVEMKHETDVNGTTTEKTDVTH